MAQTITMLLSSYYLPFQLKEPSTSTPLFSSATPPQIPIKDYLERLFQYFECSPECFLISLIYIDRLSSSFEINQVNIHRYHISFNKLFKRVLLTSLVISAKFYDDSYYSNAYYSRVGGIPNQELNQLELQLLKLLSFKLLISEEEYELYQIQLSQLDMNVIIDE